MSVMELPVRAVSVLLEQMALVLPVRTVWAPQGLLDRQDMELLAQNLVFAGLPLLVALRVLLVMGLLDKTEQWVPMVMVMVVPVLKVVERLDTATVLLVRTAMVRVLPDGMPGFVVWQFLRMVLVVLSVDAAQNRRFRKKSVVCMARRIQ